MFAHVRNLVGNGLNIVKCFTGFIDLAGKFLYQLVDIANILRQTGGNSLDAIGFLLEGRQTLIGVGRQIIDLDGNSFKFFG